MSHAPGEEDLDQDECMVLSRRTIGESIEFLDHFSTCDLGELLSAKRKVAHGPGIFLHCPFAVLFGARFEIFPLGVVEADRFWPKLAEGIFGKRFLRKLARLSE